MKSPITKRAFFPDGTPIPNTATVPSGVLFHFLLYINNPNGGRLDISMQDVLDPGFTYEAGTLRLDNSVASCAAAACTPAEEAAIFSRMTFRERNRVLVVALFTELLCGLLPIGFDDIKKALVVIIVWHAAGRFRWCLPEKCQDDNGNTDQ